MRCAVAVDMERQAIRVKLADALQICTDQACVVNAKLTSAKVTELSLAEGLSESRGPCSTD